MKERIIARKVVGKHAVDGAGVHLVRVLGAGTMDDFDPFLMLDSFDSTNPEDYTKGFPWHPHRGIETITYLAQGEMQHEDNIGHKGIIKSGQSQWMTAGSGILHQELLPAVDRMLGLQFWLNLPKSEKMTNPKYFDITEDLIGIYKEEGVNLKVIAGSYNEIKGVKPPHIPATLYDLTLEPNTEFVIPIESNDTAFVFLLEGDGIVAGEDILEKTAVLLTDGDCVRVKAKDLPLNIIFASAPPLKEEIAWGGPIVMNTQEELQLAFQELQDQTFIK